MKLVKLLSMYAINTRRILRISVSIVSSSLVGDIASGCEINAMVYLLLLCTGFLHGASPFASNVVFYSDYYERAVREDMLKVISKGPIRELDAYISYVSDKTYLSESESADCTSKELKELFVYRALSGAFKLPNPSEGEISTGAQKFFECMSSGEGLTGIRTSIELGLKTLAKEKLSQQEIDQYYMLNHMIKRLAASLREDRQALFWKQYMREFKEADTRVIIFNLYTSLKSEAKRAHAQLTTYRRLLKRALEAQFEGDVGQS